MKKRYEKLTRTGSAGPCNRLEEKIMRVMVDEVDILGDTVGSSSSGIEVRGVSSTISISFFQLLHLSRFFFCIHLWCCNPYRTKYTKTLPSPPIIDMMGKI